MSNKSYGQYCGIATALDRLGERWTLLILRELWLSDCRFTDLRKALPGIAPNLLTDRLRQLEQHGLVEQRELPAPAARTIYALTDDGLQVVPVLRALSRFGLRFLDEPVDGRVRPRMAVHGTLGSLFDPVAAAGQDLLMRFDLDGEELWLEVRAGALVPADREGTPDLVFSGRPSALVEVCRGNLELAAAAPRLEVTGTRRAKRSFGAMFAGNCN